MQPIAAPKSHVVISRLLWVLLVRLEPQVTWLPQSRVCVRAHRVFSYSCTILQDVMF